jgi:hypothetical protein
MLPDCCLFAGNEWCATCRCRGKAPGHLCVGSRGTECIPIPCMYTQLPAHRLSLGLDMWAACMGAWAVVVERGRAIPYATSCPMWVNSRGVLCPLPLEIVWSRCTAWSEAPKYVGARARWLIESGKRVMPPRHGVCAFSPGVHRFQVHAMFQALHSPCMQPQHQVTPSPFVSKRTSRAPCHVTGTCSTAPAGMQLSCKWRPGYNHLYSGHPLVWV